MGMCSANGRRRYNVQSSLIDQAHTQNDPCFTQILQNYFTSNNASLLAQQP